MKRQILWVGLALGALLTACDATTMMDASTPPGDVDAGIDAGPPSAACEASGLSCDGAQFCERGVGFCLGPGRCMPRPADCPDPPAQVCGCDGVTYESACAAQQAGASIETEGPC